MTPYEEIESIADFLPDEGKSVTLTRRKGQLVVEDLSSRRQHQDDVNRERQLAAKQKLAEETLIGHLVQSKERLQHASLRTPVVFLVMTYAICVGLHMYYGWSAINFPVVLSVIFFSGLAYWCNEQREVKRRFIYQVCPELDRVLTERNVDKFQLLGILKRDPEMAPLTRAISRWTK